MRKAAVAEKAIEGEIAPPAKAKKSTSKQEVATVTHAAPPATPQQSMLSILIEVSRDPRVDVAKMIQLNKLLDEEREREAFGSMIAMQSARPRITKDRKSDKHKYATLEKVSSELDPLMTQFGFGLTYGEGVSHLPDHYRITAKLMHARSGWSRDYFIDLPTNAHKSPDGKNLMTPAQGKGVVVSYGRRYLKLLIFDVTIAGEDIDAELPADMTPINQTQLEKLEKAIEFKNVDEAKFLARFGISSVDALPRAKFDKAMSLIAQKDTPAERKGDDIDAGDS